jgi:hypothetical protein
MSSEKPDQIQASVAAALSRLRGDLGPTGATAPKIDEPPMGGTPDRPRPANDVRGDPFFRSIQAPPPGTGMAGRGTIPMTPFPRMQTPQEPQPQQEPETPAEEEPSVAPEASGTIDIPDMPEGEQREETVSEEVSMPEPPSLTTEPPSFTAGPQPMPEPPAQSAAAAAIAAVSANPLSRVMRGQAGPGAPSPSPAPMQRDLLADLPPPPISEPLMTDMETGPMRRKRRNRRMLAAAAVIVVIALGAWLWTSGEPSTEVPVITADATPEKIKPAAGEEGGLQVQNQNVQVLDPSTQTETETVMPEPEQPITPPAATETPIAEAPTVVETTDAAPTVQAPSVDVAPSPDVPLSETPLPAMEDNGTTAPAPAVTTTEPTQTAEAPAASGPDQQQEAVSPKVITIAPAATTPEPAPVVAAPAAQPEPAQAAAQPEPAPAAQPEPQAAAQETQQAAVTPVAPTGNTRVQLAAGKSEASVQQEWASLQKAHPTLLGGLTLHIQKVDKGSAGIFYRLQAGPLADKNAAKELCASLKQRGQDCIVATK